jgi:hypothetical protein
MIIAQRRPQWQSEWGKWTMLKHNLHEISTQMAIFGADSFVPGDYAD